MALCQARTSTKPLWGLSSSNPYHSQSRAEQSKLSAPECGTGPVGEFLSSTPQNESSCHRLHRTRVPVIDSTERGFLSSTSPEREFLSSVSEAVERSSHHLFFRFEGEVRQWDLPTRTSGGNEAANAVSCGDFNAVPETAKAVDQRRRRELSTASS